MLLVLLEICHILQLSDYRLGKIFGSRLHDLETWGDIVPPKRRPPQLQRAWVWVPNTYQPRLYPIAATARSAFMPRNKTSKRNKEQD